MRRCGGSRASRGCIAEMRQLCCSSHSGSAAPLPSLPACKRCCCYCCVPVPALLLLHHCTPLSLSAGTGDCSLWLSHPYPPLWLSASPIPCRRLSTSNTAHERAETSTTSAACRLSSGSTRAYTAANACATCSSSGRASAQYSQRTRIPLNSHVPDASLLHRTEVRTQTRLRGFF